MPFLPVPFIVVEPAHDSLQLHRKSVTSDTPDTPVVPNFFSLITSIKCCFSFTAMRIAPQAGQKAVLPGHHPVILARNFTEVVKISLSHCRSRTSISTFGDATSLLPQWRALPRVGIIRIGRSHTPQPTWAHTRRTPSLRRLRRVFAGTNLEPPRSASW